MRDVEAELVLSDPYRRVLQEDRPEFKCRCCHQLVVRFKHLFFNALVNLCFLSTWRQ